MKATIGYTIEPDIRLIGNRLSLASDLAMLRVYRISDDRYRRLTEWLEVRVDLKSFDPEKTIPELLGKTSRGPFTELTIKRL